MGYIINCTLVVCASVVMVRGISYFANTGAERLVRWQMLLMSIFVMFWNAGYAAVGFMKDPALCWIPRTFGVCGYAGFLAIEVWFVSFFMRIRVWKQISVLTGILSVVDMIVFGGRNVDTFFMGKDRMLYRQVNIEVSRFHYAYMMYMFALIVVVAIIWWPKEPSVRRKRLSGGMMHIYVQQVM